jgi:hypothetical protein
MKLRSHERRISDKKGAGKVERAKRELTENKG